jgi:hypothetical protein
MKEGAINFALFFYLIPQTKNPNNKAGLDANYHLRSCSPKNTLDYGVVPKNIRLNSRL